MCILEYGFNYVYIYVQYRPGFICICPYIYIHQNTIFPTKVSQGAAGHFDAHYDVSGRLKHLTASSGYELLGGSGEKCRTHWVSLN